MDTKLTQLYTEQKALLTGALKSIEASTGWPMSSAVEYVEATDMLDAIFYVREEAKTVQSAGYDVEPIMASIGLGLTTPLALDLFACGGGATAGLHKGGCNVVAVEIDPKVLLLGQRDKGIWLVAGDAVAALTNYGSMADFVHASPPCQAHSTTLQLTKKEHETAGLLTQTLELVRRLDVPYSVENVESDSVRKEMRNPLTLCGSMFESLPLLYRHRMFELNRSVPAPAHLPHAQKTTKMGRQHTPGERFNPVGHFTNVALGRSAMNMSWGNQHTLAQAIPPEYTWYIVSHIFGTPGPSMTTVL